MSDLLSIIDLKCRTKIGVTPEERRKAQKLLVSLEIALDARHAGTMDDVRKTVDYAVLAEEMHELMIVERKTIERLAEDIADVVLRAPAAQSVVVTVKKFALPGAARAELRITRQR